jgi:hypothetical protein
MFEMHAFNKVPQFCQPQLNLLSEVADLLQPKPGICAPPAMFTSMRQSGYIARAAGFLFKELPCVSYRYWL